MSDAEDSDISFDGSEISSDGSESGTEEIAPPANARLWISVNADDYEMPHEVRRFDRTTGITERMPIDSSPLDYFTLLTTHPETGQNMINLLVDQTNLYARQFLENGELKPHSRAHQWSDTNGSEMRAFVGIVLSMGLIKKPTIESYWYESNKTWLVNTPIFSEIMRRNRFQNILRFLHCNDNTLQVPRGQEGYDPGHKIRSVLNLVNFTFSHYYNLARDITVDESIVGFKGRNHLVQYMPAKKAHRWGPKFFLLAESDTGYVHQMHLYTGKSRVPRPQGSPGLGYEVVSDLVRPHFNRNHHVVVDNFFCSPTLCHHLFANGTYITGTVRCHRKGMPASFKGLRLPKGEMSTRQQGPLMALAYSDRRQVTFLSTFATPRINVENNARGVEREVPQVVSVYNGKMGGVDLADQHISCYDPDLRSVKMWKKILINILLRIIGNGYILYTQTRQLQKKMTRMEFHIGLIQSLVGDYREEKRNTGRKGMAPMPRRLLDRHFIHSIPDNKRKECKVCRSKVRSWCRDCSVGLCLGVCFERYHTVRDNFEE